MFGWCPYAMSMHSWSIGYSESCLELGNELTLLQCCHTYCQMWNNWQRYQLRLMGHSLDASFRIMTYTLLVPILLLHHSSPIIQLSMSQTAMHNNLTAFTHFVLQYSSEKIHLLADLKGE